MSLYYPTYPDKETGEIRTGLTLAMKFRDHNRIRRHLSLFTDRKSSEETSRYVLRMVNFRRSQQPPDGQLEQWLSTAPDRIIAKLAEWGVLPNTRVQAGKPLSTHLGDWKDSVLAKGKTAKHAAVSYQRATDVFTACRFETLNDIQPDPVRKHIVESYPGLRTRNGYTQACKGFVKWVVREGRVTSNPLACLELIGKKALRGDLRVKRFVLKPDQRALLVAKTAEAPFRWGMSGVERSLLYRLAMETGIRSNEFHELTAGMFRLDDHPRVLIADGITKNGDDAHLPIKPFAAELLKAHLENKLPIARAFGIPKSDRTAQMLRGDLELAGIPCRDGAGRKIDFHALRHTFISSLAEAGVHPKVAQDLARHSDINLTMSYYTHTALEQRAEAVAKLPDLENIYAESKVREATNDQPIAQGAKHRQGHRRENVEGVNRSGESTSENPKVDSKSTAPFKELVGSIPTSGTNEHGPSDEHHERTPTQKNGGYGGRVVG